MWTGVAISVTSAIFGFFCLGTWTGEVRETWGDDAVGFAVNALAALVLLGPGLFFTNPVVREWQQRRLRPYVEEARRYINNILVDVAMDCNLEWPSGNNRTKTVKELRKDASDLVAHIEQLDRGPSQITLPFRPLVPPVRRQVDQLSFYVRRFLILTSSPKGEIYLEDASHLAADWDELHGTPADPNEIYKVGSSLVCKINDLMTELQKADHPLLE
ncbi:hypothetical protein PHK61_30815 [Actinomycetospora lutea]|uniref:hypothetical protein n=1 Tax=Actinomycetospora lutea TaxID=663604 RepID=UPI0023670FEC|nr:hypothetical protein [Actinomycetospora lutea]MDD7942815.1 hypothetical protein [Actinomycetospora lutea]